MILRRGLPPDGVYFVLSGQRKLPTLSPFTRVCFAPTCKFVVLYTEHCLLKND